MILSQFDPSRTSTFNPCDVESPIDGFPKIGVSCFSKKLVDRIIDVFQPQEIAFLTSGNGKNPIYRISFNGHDIAFYMSPIGAPACTVAYEEIIAMGLEKLVLFGTCGVLSKEIEDLAVIVPTAAIRDEGTSYHYAEASDEIELNEPYLDMFFKILEKHNCSHVIGKTWTTDAPYRETPAKVQMRKEQGAVCVEMECASMAAVARFRQKPFFQFFYAADNLDAAKWDKRSLGCADMLSEKERIALLAFELAVEMAAK